MLNVLACMCVKSLYSCLILYDPTVVACQAPLPMGFSRQEYWSGSLCPSPGSLSDQGSNPHLLCLLNWQAGSSPLAPSGNAGSCSSSLNY